MWDIPEKRVVWRADFGLGGTLDVDWMGDGSKVVYSQGLNTAFGVVDLDGKVEHPFDRIQFDNPSARVFVESARFSPDQRLLAIKLFVEGDKQSWIYVYDLGKGVFTSRCPEIYSKTWFLWSPDSRYIILKDNPTEPILIYDLTTGAIHRLPQTGEVITWMANSQAGWVK